MPSPPTSPPRSLDPHDHRGHFNSLRLMGWSEEAIEHRRKEPLNELVEACAATSREKGFHDSIDTHYLRVARNLMADVVHIAAELEAIRKDRPLTHPLSFDDLTDVTDEQLNAGLKLLLIISEATEAFVAVCREPDKEPEEIADIAIRLFDYCGIRNIDLDREVRAKMAKNRDRPHKHNCRF